MLAMSQKAVVSLLSSTVKLGVSLSELINATLVFKAFEC